MLVGSLFVNYLLEFAMLLPAAVMALLPLRKHLRFRPVIVYVAAFDSVAAIAVIGSIASSTFNIPTNYVLAPCALLYPPLKGTSQSA